MMIVVNMPLKVEDTLKDSEKLHLDFYGVDMTHKPELVN